MKSILFIFLYLIDFLIILMPIIVTVYLFIEYDISLWWSVPIFIGLSILAFIIKALFGFLSYLILGND